MTPHVLQTAVSDLLAVDLNENVEIIVISYNDVLVTRKRPRRRKHNVNFHLNNSGRTRLSRPQVTQAQDAASTIFVRPATD